MSAIYIHNPRCSKSRQGIKILEDNNQRFEIIEYLKTPLTKKILGDIFTYLSKNHDVKEFTRTKEKTFKEQGLNIKDFSTKTSWVNLINENPVLLERPILLLKNSAILGRPPENFNQ